MSKKPSSSHQIDALSEARNKDLLEMESMLDAAPMEKNIITTKDRRKYDSSAQKDFHPTVVLGAPSGVTSASPPGKSSSATPPSLQKSKTVPISPRGTRLDLSPRKEAPAQAASPAKEASSASKTSKVVVISQHREEFLAPGSVEYGIGEGNSIRWLTSEDLEIEFGPKVAQKMIDDYDVDSVNNMKRSLEKSANSTAIKPVASSSAAASPPPPPIPNRNNRSNQSGIISPRSPKKEEAPAAPAAASSFDKKVAVKEKLATLKSLFEEGLISKEEYDKRRNVLVDELMN